MVYFLLILVIIVVVIERQSTKIALKHISYTCKPEEYLIEPEKEFNLIISVHNNSRIPIFYLKTRCSVPEDIILSENQIGKLEIYGNLSEYSLTTYLMPGQHKEFKITMSLPKRGLYRFSKFAVTVGDFLGIATKTLEISGSSDAVVIPKKLEHISTRYITGGLIGEHSINRWIHEDPILTVGFREYTGHEPQKAISWSRSLQSQRLMVKQFDHTTDRKVSIILWTENDPDEKIEYCLSLCRTLCEFLNNEGVPFSMYHSGCLFTSIGSLENIRAGLGGVHMERIYEALGRASIFDSPIAVDILTSRIINTEYDSNCFIVISSNQNNELSEKMRRLASNTGSDFHILTYENREAL